jgi:hypothetical protein
MTPAQVEIAEKGRAPQGAGTDGQRVERYIVGNAGSYVLGDIPYNVAFYYQENHLNMVKLTPPDSQCAAVEASLKKVFGEPRSHNSDWLLSMSYWQDSAFNNEVQFVKVGNTCSITYEPFGQARLESGL